MAVSPALLTLSRGPGAPSHHGRIGRDARLKGSPAMQAHRIRVVVPEDHRAVVEFPEAIRSGPVELIVLVPPENEAEEGTPEGKGRMASLADDLAKDPRSFRDLSPEERSSRIERVMGAGRGLMSTSEDFARRKREEIEIEEQKFAR